MLNSSVNGTDFTALSSNGPTGRCLIYQLSYTLMSDKVRAPRGLSRLIFRAKGWSRFLIHPYGVRRSSLKWWTSYFSVNELYLLDKDDDYDP